MLAIQYGEEIFNLAEIYPQKEWKDYKKHIVVPCCQGPNDKGVLLVSHTNYGRPTAVLIKLQQMYVTKNLGENAKLATFEENPPLDKKIYEDILLVTTL